MRVETVRFYQRKGLMPAPRAGRGWTDYDEGAIARLRLIRRARGLGFTLREIVRLLEARGSNGSCVDIMAMFRERRGALLVRLRETESALHAIDEMLGACPRTGPAARCPALELLATDT